MKKTLTVILIIIFAVAAAGCQKKKATEAKSDKPLISAKADKGPPLPLDEVVAGNSEALEMATNTVDYLEGDEFIGYVNRAKERDKNTEAASSIAEQLAQTMANALVTMVDELQTAMVSGLGEVGLMPVDDGGSSGTSGSSGTNSGSTGGSGSGDATSSSGNTGTAMTKYTSSANGFSIDFPGDWAVSEAVSNGKDTVTAKSDGDGDAYPEKIAVEVEDLPLTMSSSDYLDDVIADLSAASTSFSEVSRADTSIDGKAAKKVVYTDKSGGVDIKVLMYVVTSGYKGYAVKGSARTAKYSASESTFKSSSKSLNLSGRT